MRLTSKGRYAIRAMLDLTTHSSGQPVRLQEISTRQNISLHYLEQLFRRLRNGSVVKSVRGPGGGYVLARSMDEITIKTVLDCVGENINPAKDIIGSESEMANTVEYHLSRNYFSNLAIIMKEYLTTTSLGDLVRKSPEVKIENNANNQNNQNNNENKANTVNDISLSLAQAIRNPVGEVNQ